MEEKTIKFTEEQAKAFEDFQSMKYEFLAFKEAIEKEKQKQERQRRLVEDFKILEPIIDRKLQEKAGVAVAAISVAAGIALMFKAAYDAGKLSK
jgi:hypothetical protein